MKQNEKAAIAILGGFTAVLLFYGGWRMLGPLSPYWDNEKTGWMIGELSLFFLWNYLCVRKIGNGFVRILGVLISVILFTWCHQAFLPVLVSGFYLLYLLGTGRMFRKCLDGTSSSSSVYSAEKAAVDFLIGSAVFIVLVCLMSAWKVGGIRNLRLAVIVTGLLALFWNLFSGPDLRRAFPSRPKSPVSAGMAALSVLILTMFMLQAGRMNIALDYDSLHYGLRTPYILNNGTGIYENLGNINLVYTYTKGLETLVMPLSGTSTYGYVLSFNLWVTVGVLFLVYDLTKRLSDRFFGLVAAAILSCIPGVMNMAATAKSDCITLLFQLMFLYFMVMYLRQGDRVKRTRYFVLAGCACLMTYLFKPTALVFSTFVFGLGLIYLIYSRQLSMKMRSRWWLCVIPIAAAWMGLWARTLLLTGVPVTSVFTSIFEVLGFRVKEPFAFAAIPSNGAPDFWGSLAHLLRRLFLMLTAPVGKDMDHVIIAWGSPVIAVLLLLLLLQIHKKPYETWQEKQVGAYLRLCLWGLALVSLVSVFKLWQVDGNYFMLFYTLLVIQGVLAVSRCRAEGFGRAALWIFAPVLLFNVGITCASNWAGTVGFTPVKLFHKGYYDHLLEARLEKEEDGNKAIWNLLASDPTTRVLAIGEHPGVLTFPCNIQSYYDLTGSGGNVYLVKTLDNFKGFLKYAKTEYLYVQAEYMEPGTRVWDIVNYMIEDGSLANIRYEYGNMLARINLDGHNPASPREAMREFYTLYIPGKPSKVKGD